MIINKYSYLNCNLYNAYILLTPEIWQVPFFFTRNNFFFWFLVRFQTCWKVNIHFESKKKGRYFFSSFGIFILHYRNLFMLLSHPKCVNCCYKRNKKRVAFAVIMHKFEILSISRNCHFHACKVNIDLDSKNTCRYFLHF